MSILSGFKKYKNYKANANGDHQLQSFWTSTDTVEDANGNTLTSILANLPNPMVMRGTVGAQEDNPTITALPVDGSATIGDTYKVITDGTYDSVVAKIGDFFTCITKTSSANTWSHIPAGDDSIVIANPQGTVTDNLETVSIDGVIYSVKDGDAMIKGVDYVTAGRKSGTTAGEKTTAEGYETTASYAYAHAEGQSSVSSGQASHAEGYGGTASGNYSHVEGESNTASGRCAHAEGNNTSASSNYTHTEGRNTTASDQYAHAEGFGTIASSETAHAENCYTTASGFASHAEGLYTIASQSHQHVQGKYNIEDENGRYAHIVGGGTSDSDRKNIHTLDWYGNAKFAGEVEDGNGNKLSDLNGSQTLTGNPITITDSSETYAEELSVDLEPNQDLHGYDKPWVGGAGKNLLEVQSNSSVYNGITFTVNRDNNRNVVSITANGTATATTYYKIMEGFVAKAGVSYTISGSPGGINGVMIYNDNHGKAWNDYDTPTVSFDSDTTMPIYIRVGNGVTLSNAIFQPMIEQGTVKSAFAPYSNISPIQGYDIVSVDRCGKNLVFQTITGASINSSGKVVSNSAIDLNIAKVEQGVTYTATEDRTPSNQFVCGFFTEIPVVGSTTYNGGRYGETSPTFTAPISGYVAFWTNTGYATPMLEIGLTKTTYEPYNGQTVSLQLGNKNLLPMTVEGIKETDQDSTWSGNSLTTNGVTFTIVTNSNGIVTKIHAKRVSTSSNIAFLNLCFGQTLSGNYLVNGGNTNSNFYIRIGEGTNPANSGSEKAKNLTGDTAFTADSSKYYAFSLAVTGLFTGETDIYPMLRSASVTDPTFSPYNPTLGGMVYGGQLTLKDDGSAVFVGDKASVDLGSLNWNYNRVFYFNGFTQAKLPSSNSQIANIISSIYKAVADDDVLSTNGATSLGTTGQLCVNDSRYTSVSDFKTAVTGQTLVYELATSFTIHLSAEQLKLLQGTNNIWSNAGDVTLKYQPDNVIAEPKADVQRLRDDVDNMLVGNACRNLFPQTNVTIANNARNVSITLPLPIGTYSLSAIVESTDTDSNQCLIIGYDVNEEVIINQNINRSKNRTSITFTINAKLQRLLFYASTTYSGGLNDSAVFKDVQLERGSTPHAYEPYIPTNAELYNKTLVNKSARIPITSANTWINTGMSVTIPPNSFYSIHCEQVYNNKIPSGVLLSYDATHHEAAYSYEYMAISDYAHCCISSYTSRGVTIYAYIKAEGVSSSGNDCKIKGWYEPAIYKNVIT